jgi:hypothetical protein
MLATCVRWREMERSNEGLFRLLTCLVVRLPINLGPVPHPANHQTLRFQPGSPDCVVSPADGTLAEVPANPLAWLVLCVEKRARSEISNIPRNIHWIIIETRHAL